MEPNTVVLLGFGLLFFLMIIRVPVGIAMAISGVVGFAMVSGWEGAFRLLGQSPMRQATDNDLSVIPLFILMGAFATSSGMSKELLRAASAWFGHLRGGLGISTLMACAGFASINGSAVATTATMTSVALPELRRAGYEAGAAGGLIAAGGTLGIMIPPSVIFVIYGILTDTDIGKLFVAGIVPGLVGLLFYCASIRYCAWRHPERFPCGDKASWKERLDSLKSIWATVLLFICVVGVIYGGVATVTEAAGIGAIGALAIGWIRRRLTLQTTIEALIDALRTSCSIFMIVIGAYLFGYFITVTGAAQTFADAVTALDLGAMGTLALILVIYLGLGAVMDELAMILLTIPIVFPMIIGLGFDPVWFGVIIVMTVTLGMTLPPVGMNVFVVNSLARDVSLPTIYRGVMPYITADIIRLIVLCAFPSISLGLVGMMK